mmetsp:Transcript_518/g.1220  ORF Transcript_518/g.1220 Transcript_518/m.1220 type:complete len:147 (-) Transcript_518:413-853(-)
MMGPETKTSYQGGGMARVDVYCRTGTVCTCHMVPVTTGDVATTICSSDAILVPNSNSLTLFSRQRRFQSHVSNDDDEPPPPTKSYATNPPLKLLPCRQPMNIEMSPRILKIPPLLVVEPSCKEQDNGSSVGSSQMSSAGSSMGSQV